MLINQYPLSELQAAMKSDGIRLDIGPFTLRLRSTVPDFASTLALLYEGITIETDPASYFNDFNVNLRRPWHWRRYLNPYVTFDADVATPFQPFRQDHTFPHFEWGLNWLIASRAHQYLMFHAAVLERHGGAMIMPAFPGSGKSTLCAALMLRGWRLLSDEFGLYRPETGLLEPLPRPIPLKNESIDIIRDFSTDAVLGPTYPQTRKGKVAHVRPSKESIAASGIATKPRWVVFPQYLAGATELLHPFATGRAFLKLSGNAFNYRLQAARGFTAIADVVEGCDTWYLEFSDLDKAVSLLEEMTLEQEQARGATFETDLP